MSVAVRTTSKLHTALPQKTWRGAAQDMSFRIQPAGEKNHKPDVFKTATRIHGEEMETSPEKTTPAMSQFQKKSDKIRL